ncbi:hypothetical protein CIRG_03758 [Coccidioides immitis RMSCC 2394]|uniref:Uncharacterized protein n=1 Tax=Coccidioides immitis RMSCC 2394 TaxID=404692 RepID=A0A0J7B2Q6_COCIT|nr:hypothetical protein CIRG_03758 [Coccidioides immitis RMSCC 2394]
MAHVDLKNSHLRHRTLGAVVSGHQLFAQRRLNNFTIAIAITITITIVFLKEYPPAESAMSVAPYRGSSFRALIPSAYPHQLGGLIAFPISLLGGTHLSAIHTTLRHVDAVPYGYEAPNEETTHKCSNI